MKHKFLMKRGIKIMVRHKVALFFIASILPHMFLNDMCLAFDDGDFQYWNTEGISFRISDKWKVKLEEEFRFGDDVSDFYYQHSDLGVTYSGFAEWFDAGINYRLIFNEKKGKWKYENRAHFNCAFKFDLHGVHFSDRNRFEYRDREDEDESWRYRNKFTIKLAKFTQFEIQPYVADEIFVDFDEEVLNRNRLSSGISLMLLKNLKGDIFYLWQSSKKSKVWIDYNVLGTKLTLSF